MKTEPKIQTRMWKTLDLHYMESQQAKADKMIKRLEKRGWIFQQIDSPGANGRQLVAQLITNTKIKEV